jgi:hypothetical protein
MQHVVGVTHKFTPEFTERGEGQFLDCQQPGAGQLGKPSGDLGPLALKVQCILVIRLGPDDQDLQGQLHGQGAGPGRKLNMTDDRRTARQGQK